ncbi:MAG: Amuc_1100 family pilus-like protein [Kiritimatiellae bacterium]|nr:Amuc_1100 family pilus-like protein [Kiritimatiellia bacterium]
MNWRKNIILIVGGGIALVLLIVATVFLLKSRREYQTANEALDREMQSLERLTRRNPYPSTANIEQVDKNLEALKTATITLQEALERGQIKPAKIESAEFAPMLERASKQLYKAAADAGVALPDQFSLGLSRYAQGELPAPEAIPRLVIQLKTLHALTQILIESRIQALIGVERQQFESSGVASSDEQVISRRRAVTQDAQPATSMTALPMPASNTLYEVERFSLTFQARDANVWEVLNRLVRSPMLIVVVDAQLANMDTAKIGKPAPVQPIGGEQGATASAGLPLQSRYPSHEERVIAGRELVQATVIVDVYRLVQEITEDAP